MQTIPMSPPCAPVCPRVSAPAAAWTPILAAYVVYLGIALLGYLLGHNVLVWGGLVFVAVVSVAYSHHLVQVPATAITLAVIFAGIIPLIALTCNTLPSDAMLLGTLIKHHALYLVLLITLQLRLMPLSHCPQRVWVYGAIVAMLLISLLYERLTGTATFEGRASGLFDNPNNLAVMSMCLFCLINDGSRWYVHWATHGLVLALLLLSGTSGALVGYCVGQGYRWCQSRQTARVLLLAGIIFTAGALLAPEAIYRACQTFSPTRAVVEKIKIARENVPLILEGRGINYWRLVERSGTDMTSGLWHLAHWRKTINVYGAGTPLQWVCGRGLGTSELLLGKKPHNDYLRVLFEMGIAGCLVLAIIWGGLFLHMAPAARWVVVMVATYALTENNADNFIAICLLMLFIVSARRWPAGMTCADQVRPGVASGAP